MSASIKHMQITLKLLCRAGNYVAHNATSSKMKIRQCQRVFASLRRHYCSVSPRDILKLNQRGIFQNVFPEKNTQELVRKLGNPLTVYCGFDPTADSLHIGNLLAVIALLHCQRAGHHPICLVGGATGMLGDPSGKTKDRDPLPADQIESNVIALTKSLHRIIENHRQYIWQEQRDLPDFKILNNADWYREKNIIEFISKVGRYFRMGPMLSRHSVQTRLNSSVGLSFTEFTYQMFQAYDWLHLLMEHNCTVQIGGNDQIGNITAGYELISKVKGDLIWGLTVPLVTTTSGDKLGKTAGNAVWLNADKTSPYELYQYFLNLADCDIEKYLNLFTFLTKQNILDVIAQHKAKPESRAGQKKIANSVVTLVHGEKGLKEAKLWTDALFGGSIDSLARLCPEDMQKLFSNASTVNLMLEPGTTVIDVVMKAKCFDREVDAERTIKQGGIYINHQRVTEPNYVLIPGEHILPNDITLLRKGKKNFFIVNWDR